MLDVDRQYPEYWTQWCVDSWRVVAFCEGLLDLPDAERERQISLLSEEDHALYVNYGLGKAQAETQRLFGDMARLFGPTKGYISIREVIRSREGSEASTVPLSPDGSSRRPAKRTTTGQSTRTKTPSGDSRDATRAHRPGPPAACVSCGSPLEGRQRRFCSRMCKASWTETFGISGYSGRTGSTADTDPNDDNAEDRE